MLLPSTTAKLHVLRAAGVAQRADAGSAGVVSDCIHSVDDLECPGLPQARRSIYRTGVRLPHSDLRTLDAHGRNGLPACGVVSFG